jgi:hypothetical protein
MQCLFTSSEMYDHHWKYCIRHSLSLYLPECKATAQHRLALRKMSAHKKGFYVFHTVTASKCEKKTGTVTGFCLSSLVSTSP